MTSMTPLGAPPPTAGSRQAWPPPPDIAAPPASPAAEDDPWASWYDKPRARQLDTPSATIPRVPPAAGRGSQQYDAPGYGQQDGADQQYQGSQQYPGTPPYDAAQFGNGQYGAPQQYGQYAGPQQQPGPQYAGPQQQPGPQYGGPQHPDPQFGGAPTYADPQFGGAPTYADPQFGGPQYGDPQYGGPQYGGPQYTDPQYGGPQYAGPPARGASRLSALRSRGPLIPIAAVGAVAVVVIVVVLASSSSHGTPSQTASQGTPGSTQSASGPSQDAAQRAAATRLSGMLKKSGAYHANVNAAVGDVESCQHLGTAQTAFSASARNRQNLLSELGTLPGRATLPAALVQDLTGAWQASITVDNDLAEWAQDQAGGGCNPKKVQNDSHYQASLNPDNTATSDKQALASAWAPIAAKYGLPAYKWSQI
ncbi:MAG: hypothetical protein JWM19_3630 [Actinomycetia bacterium]|nr:hypothetical protein [Actinomycetes bacterium]